MLIRFKNFYMLPGELVLTPGEYRRAVARYLSLSFETKKEILMSVELNTVNAWEAERGMKFDDYLEDVKIEESIARQ